MATNQEKLDLAHDRAKKYLDVPISAVAKKVWEVTVKRGGQNISALQELADCKTLAQQNKAAIAALTSLVGQLAKGQTVDYARIQTDTAATLKEGLADGVVLDINLNGKDA